MASKEDVAVIDSEKGVQRNISLRSANAASTPAAVRRKLEQVDANNNMATLPVSLIAEAFNSKGLDAFSTDGLDSFAGTTVVASVKLLEVSGCDSLQRDLGAVHGVAMMNGVSLEVHCTSTACAAFYDQANLRKPGQVQQPAPEYIAEMADKLGINVTGLEELGVKYTNATNATAAGRRLAAATRQGIRVCHKQYDSRGNLIRQLNCYTIPCTCKNCGKCDWDGTDNNANRHQHGHVRDGLLYWHLWLGHPADCLHSHTPRLLLNVPAGGWMVDGNCGCKEAGCFPADADVEVRGRGTVRIADLAYGDEVLAVDRATGRREFREVYLFAHREPDAIGTYVGISTQSGRSLKLTPQHYIPVCISGCTAAAFATHMMLGGSEAEHDQPAAMPSLCDCICTIGAQAGCGTPAAQHRPHHRPTRSDLCPTPNGGAPAATTTPLAHNTV
jgi:hypothetical protein